MRVRRARAGLIAVVAAAALIGSCGAEKRQPAPDDDHVRFSAENLPDLDKETSILDQLEPEERAAVERSGMSGPGEGSTGANPEPAEGSKGKTAERAAISILTVAVSVGAAVAPYLLF
jgi:hypothetical protein